MHKYRKRVLFMKFERKEKESRWFSVLYIPRVRDLILLKHEPAGVTIASATRCPNQRSCDRKGIKVPVGPFKVCLARLTTEPAIGRAE
jgi:hypothetical protein